MLTPAPRFHGVDFCAAFAARMPSVLAAAAVAIALGTVPPSPPPPSPPPVASDLLSTADPLECTGVAELELSRILVGLRAAINGLVAGIPVPRAGRILEVDDKDHVYTEENTVGIAITGGGPSGIIDAVCYLDHLNNVTEGALDGAEGPKKVIMSTNSGGTVAWAVWNSAKVVCPALRPDYTVEDIRSWPAGAPDVDSTPALGSMSRYLVNQPQAFSETLFGFNADVGQALVGCAGGVDFACEILSSFADDGFADARLALSLQLNARLGEELYTSTGLRDLFLAIAGCRFTDSEYPCLLFAGLLATNVNLREPKAGALPWLIEMSFINHFDGPFGAGELELDASEPIEDLEDNTAFAIYQQLPDDEPGTLDTPSKAFNNHFFIRSFNTRDRSFLAAIEAGDSKQGFPVDLAHAIAFSADFTTVSISAIQRGEEPGQTCPASIFFDPSLACEEQARARDELASGMQVLGNWKRSKQMSALATDGGVLEGSGVVPLLRAKVKDILVLNVNNRPWGARCGPPRPAGGRAAVFSRARVRADVSNVGLSFLFGVRTGSNDLCDSGLRVGAARPLASPCARWAHPLSAFVPRRRALQLWGRRRCRSSRTRTTVTGSSCNLASGGRTARASASCAMSRCFATSSTEHRAMSLSASCLSSTARLTRSPRTSTTGATLAKRSASGSLTGKWSRRIPRRTLR